MSAEGVRPKKKKRKGTKDERLKRSQILLDVTRRCASLANIQDVWKEMVSMTSYELDCDRGTLFLNDKIGRASCRERV